MSVEPLHSHHRDFAVLAPVVAHLVASADGMERLSADVPLLLRTAIDEVIDSRRTNRFTIAEIEKTEKTYLGTKVEILLRNLLKLPKGHTLDLIIGGIECDIKHTMGGNWSIPRENVGHPAILVRENELTARCDFGVGIMRVEYLNPAPNQDQKRGIARAHFADIWWILRDHPYPANLWEVLPGNIKAEILSAKKGTARIVKLFDLIRETPISRTQIEAIAQQLDSLKRIRRNGGARDILAPRGIAVLSGVGDRDLIEKLGLKRLLADEFISYAPKSESEAALLKMHGHID